LGQPSASTEIIRQIKQKNMKHHVFGALSILGENPISNLNLKKYENVVLISYGNTNEQRWVNFHSDYKRENGKMPGKAAVYAYDGVNLIIEAIKKSGLDRNKVQNALLKMRYEGITGLIQFDVKGNRQGEPGLIEIKNGISLALKK
jgi:ABC-type branched-subunit amino acid transport system substrate-binding protein